MKFQCSGFRFFVSFPDTRNLTPDTLKFGACDLGFGISDYEMFDDLNDFYDFSFLSALFNAAMCTSPAKCTGLLPCIGSQPEGSAQQKNCVSRPMRTSASFTGNPSTRLAASQVAPQGAPRHTWMRSILPFVISTANSGAPKCSPY